MASLGETLSAERRRQSKTLVDAESATNIRARMLEALENGDHDALPSHAYVKGYIQSYAKFLDIPAEPLLEMYRSESKLHDDRLEQLANRPIMPRGASYSRASRQNLDDLPADQVVPQREQQHAIPTPVWIALALVIVIVGAIIWGVSQLLSTPETPAEVPRAAVETPAPSAAASGSAVATETTQAAPSAIATEATPTAPTRKPIVLSFSIMADHKSALKVTSDGVVVYDDIISSTTLPPEIKVLQEAVIVIGKPLWVTTKKDGARVPTPNQQTSYTLTIKNENPPQ